MKFKSGLLGATFLFLPWITFAADSYIIVDADSRTSLDLTVYNSNLAVVRDYREVVLPLGEVELEYLDVAITIQPPTVTMSTSARRGLRVDQQNYRYDLLNRRSLLERFVGRKLKYSRFLLEDGTFEKVLREGILLSIEPEIVKFGDVIEIEPEGTISLAYLPEDLKTTPTLVFRGNNAHEGEQAIAVRYHAGGIGWEADYAMTMAGGLARLDGWVTIRNQSGSDYQVDKLRLIAGDVNRVPVAAAPMMRESMAMMNADVAPAMQRSEVGDYHAYDVPGEVTLLKNDMTQLHLIAAEGIRVEETYRLVSNAQRYGNEGVTEQSPSTWVSFENISRNNLDTPLPGGTIRVYDGNDDRETFIGESGIVHTPAGSEVRIETGRAFDLSSKRTQTGFRRIGDRIAEVSYRVELSSARDEEVSVFVEEKLGGSWEVVRESQPGQRADAQTYVFEVDLPARGKAGVEYTVRFNW